MELKELTEKTIGIFNIEGPESLSDKLLEVVLKNEKDKLTKFKELINSNLEVDWLQKIYQYYLADRENKKQDYTPTTMAKLVAEVTTEENEKVVADLCAGSGALTIQKWITNKELKFLCFEMDESVIPFLLFNLTIRNMEGFVFVGSVFNDPIKIYKVTKGTEYSSVSEIPEAPEIIVDTVISNPPFNIPWDAKEILEGYSIPPASNANYAFILKGIKLAKNSCFILPNCVLSSSIKEELELRTQLLNNNRLFTVYEMPGKMFESTSIPTCILHFKENSSGVNMFNLTEACVDEIREQRGQYGGNSHTKRVYKKQIKVVPDGLSLQIKNHILGKNTVNGFYKFVDAKDVIEEGAMSPRRFIPMELEEDHRSFEDIVKNINDIKQQKNLMKLTINETIAKGLGIDIELHKENKNVMEETLKEKLGLDIMKDDYIAFSKKAGEFKFANNDKKEQSTLAIEFYNCWKSNIRLLNVLENKYLEELRDALLPELMAGNIELID